MYPVDLHMHTVASTHAYSTLHDYIAEAQQKGIKLFAITDHGGHGRCAALLALYEHARVAAPGERRGHFARHRSQHQNLQGDIDCTGPMLTATDVIIAGFHEPVFAPQDKASILKR